MTLQRTIRWFIMLVGAHLLVDRKLWKHWMCLHLYWKNQTAVSWMAKCINSTEEACIALRGSRCIDFIVFLLTLPSNWWGYLLHPFYEEISRQFKRNCCTLILSDSIKYGVLALI